MAKRLFMQRLDRITLVQKSGGKLAKHPELRTGVIEVVKAGDDWYQTFADFITQCPDDDIPDDWCAAFAAAQGPVDMGTEADGVAVEKAGKAKNYPDTEGPFAGPHNSFPIRSQADVSDAARLIGHAQNPAAVKAKIIAIAKSRGYSLPKSWTSTKVNKSEFIAALRSTFFGEETGVVVEDDQSVDVEKAANPMHSHSHAHLSSYGYSYSHTHDHSHRDGVTPNSADHDDSETGHAHQHVSKAGASVTPEQIDGLLADVKGLAEKVSQLETALSQKDEALAEVQGQLETVEKARDEALAHSEALEAEKTEAVEKATQLDAQLTEAARHPLTAAPVAVEKAQPAVTRDMKFDDAFNALMGRQSPIPVQ